VPTTPSRWAFFIRMRLFAEEPPYSTRFSVGFVHLPDVGW